MIHYIDKAKSMTALIKSGSTGYENLIRQRVYINFLTLRENLIFISFQALFELIIFLPDECHVNKLENEFDWNVRILFISLESFVSASKWK